MRTALYRHWDADGQLLYVGISLSALSRLSQHKATSSWFEDIAKVTVEYYPSRAEALAAETLAIVTERPIHNKAKSTTPQTDTRAAAQNALYLVREAGSDVLHGLVWGSSLAELFRTFDEFGDPTGYEFAPVDCAGGIVHRRQGLRVIQWSDMTDEDEEADDDRLEINLAAFGASELTSSMMRRMESLEWRPFVEASAIQEANDNEPMRQAA